MSKDAFKDAVKAAFKDEQTLNQTLSLHTTECCGFHTLLLAG